MPLPEMFTNVDALNQARKNFNRKIKFADLGVRMVPKPVLKDEEGNELKLSFDVRYPKDFACLLIDTEDVPDEELEDYFIEETKKIAKAFFSVDEVTRKPDPAAIKPYIEKVFKKMICDANIDWNDAKEVEKFLATEQASQGFATLVNDFPDVILDLYPTFDQIRWFDNYTAKATAIINRGHVIMSTIPDPEADPQKQAKALLNYESVEDRLIYEVTHKIFDAKIQESNDIYLDAVSSDFTKKYFLKEDFEETVNDDLFTDDSYAGRYLEHFVNGYKNAGVEQMINLPMAKTSEDDYFEYGRVFINGKSMRDYIAEIEKTEQSHFNVQVAAGKLFRDALTDGKSVVTLMRVETCADGACKFSHQEIKVDLNQLNKANKENYSLFRRILDWAHIWKIQKYNSNDERDKAQKTIKDSDAFKDALRAAEDKFISQYNSTASQDWLAQNKPALAAAFPKIVRAEDLEKENPVSNNPDRVPITDIKDDLVTTVSVEPPHEDLNKTLSNEKQYNQI